MSRNITYSFKDYLENIEYIEKEDGTFRSFKCMHGIIVGVMLFVGPAYQPDETGELRPFSWVHYLSGHDIGILYKEVLGGVI